MLPKLMVLGDYYKVNGDLDIIFLSIYAEYRIVGTVASVDWLDHAY